MSEETLQRIFTVGHSNHSLDTLVNLIQRHGVNALADVRSMPYSRFNPQFNRNDLEKALINYGISYVFLGLELGGRTEYTSCYRNGRVIYERVAKTELFLAGMDRLITGTTKYRIALMCAEKEPLNCHRTLLVAQGLHKLGIPVAHIHADGRVESHQDAMIRLLDLLGFPHEELFRSREQIIEDALLTQQEKIAYADKETAPNSTGT